jgi:hypothetical protein
MATNVWIELPSETSGGGSGVSSFNGRTGAVVPLAGDYTASQITNVPSGNISSLNVQNALNELDSEKQALITGAATSITLLNLTINRALISDGSGKVAVSATTSTELGFVSGVTSSIQTQLNAKGTGSVTSVALSAPVSVFSISGSPVTTSGTLALSFINQSANTVLAGPTSGGAAAPAFRSLVAADIPSISLTSGVSGILPIANGGTNASSAPAARVSLNIDERTTFNNANYTAVSTDRYVAQVGTMTSSRTVTLPLASSVNAGQSLIIIDESGTVNTSNTIIINRAGSDLINGLTSSTLRSAYGRAILYSNGSNAWTDSVTGISRGGTGLTTLPINGQLLIGNTTTNAYSLSTLTAGPGITITNSPGSIQINNSSIGVGTLNPGLVSDGVDGDVTISVNTTLTRDMDYNSLVVNAGVNLNTGGYTIFCKTSLTVSATGLITRNGNVGGNAATSSAGAAGAAIAGVTTGTGNAGAAGGAGTTAAGGSGATSAAVSGEGGGGGVGGNGGGGSGGVGGSGGNSGVVTIRYFRNVQSNWKYTAVGTYMPMGSGGAGGAAGGGDGVNLGRGGGGGGSSGGGIMIICDSLNNLGTIQAKGGAGGNGGGSALGNVGGGAGGGGGGGGKIMILANTLTSRGTLDVSGGAAGTGSAGAGTGIAGTNGSAGNPGYATTFEASTGTWTTTS